MKDLVILGEKDLKVTSVTPFKNNKYKVSFDLADDVLVNEDELVKYRLVKGKELDNETYNLIIRNNILYEAYNKALVYSSNYIKCLKEIYDYLIKKGYNQDISKNVCEMLKENKIIDDEAYLKLYVSKLIRDGYGKLMIEYKVKEKKLDLNYEIDIDLYFETLNSLILKKLKTLKDKKKERLYRYLQSRGYTIDDIKTALEGVRIE